VLENAEADAASTKYGVLEVLAAFYGLPETSDLIALGENRADETQAAS
jgi:hypothetical protein